MIVEVLFCAIVCANKMWVGVVGGYFSNKDCHFDTKDGASKEWRPHMCRCPSSFVLDVLKFDYVSLVIGRISVFVPFFLEIPVEIAVIRRFSFAALAVHLQWIIVLISTKSKFNFLNFTTIHPLNSVAYYAYIIS